MANPTAKNNNSGSTTRGGGTPRGTSKSLPNSTDLETQVQNDACPVKDVVTARRYLDEHSWLLASEQFSREKLANILFAISLEDKSISKDAKSAVRAVAFILLDEFEENFANSLFNKISDKIAVSIDTATKQIETSANFIKSTSDTQAAETLKVTNAATALQTELDKATKVTTTLQTSVTAIDTTIDKLSSLSKFAETIAESSKKMAQSVEELSKTPPKVTLSPPPNPNTQSSYASIAANGTPQSSPSSTFNSNTPDYIQRIKNRLALQSKQLYISFEASDTQAPKDRGGPAAFVLRGKLNELMKELDIKTGQQSTSSGAAIKALQFTERSAMLLEFDTPDSTARFNKYAKEHNLLTRICPTAKIQPRTYRIVMKFVPCDGTFDPSDRSQLRELESDQDLPDDAILAASWIKKPSLRAPNQKTANVKVICSDPVTANKLLTNRVFISNALVSVQKDLQEPIRCNKCQQYGHIRENCPNPERCANCARDHPTPDCNHPNDHHCVSCGTSSTHSSSDRNKCPQFTKHASSLDARLPENSMPYFPVLNQDWTFVLAPKNNNASTASTSNRPKNNSQRSNTSQPQQNNKGKQPQQPRQQQQVQTTLQSAGQFVFPQGFVPPAGFNPAFASWQPTQPMIAPTPHAGSSSLPLPSPQPQWRPVSPFANGFEPVGNWYNNADYSTGHRHP